MVQRCKKLPCTHIFHTTCLRSWFQRQQVCPTCRYIRVHTCTVMKVCNYFVSVHHRMDVLSHSATAQRTRRQPPVRPAGGGGGGGIPGVPGQPAPGGMFNPMMPPPHMWPHPGMVPPQPPAPPNPAEGVNQLPVPPPVAGNGQGAAEQGRNTCVYDLIYVPFPLNYRAGPSGREDRDRWFSTLPTGTSTSTSTPSHCSTPYPWLYPSSTIPDATHVWNATTFWYKHALLH